MRRIGRIPPNFRKRFTLIQYIPNSDGGYRLAQVIQQNETFAEFAAAKRYGNGATATALDCEQISS